MASNASNNPQVQPVVNQHWLHAPAGGWIAVMTGRQEPGSPLLTSLEVQIFITKNGKDILLFESESIKKWTSPSVVIKANDTRSLFQITLNVLQNAIEERVLPDLQFLDHTSISPPFERLRQGHMLVKIHLTTAISTLDTSTTTTIYCDQAPFSNIRWVDLKAPPPQLRIANITPFRLNHIRDRMTISDMQLRAAHRAPDLSLKALYANTVKAAIKTKEVDLGEKIEHTVIARSAENTDVLYLMVGNVDMLREISQQQHWRIVNPKPVPQGMFRRKEYNIIGWARKEGVEMGNDYSSPGMLRDHCRIQVEWIQRTKETRLGPGLVPQVLQVSK